ncbi:hypothetical protein [Psychroserpens mesophilus]|uniref:hypothetical protein n=1 Tax=Psychroserpens mesophilus TaxID=325473 RepID=UPI003D658711
MKKITTLLTALILITSCSTSDDSISEPQETGDCFCQTYGTPVALEDNSIELGITKWVSTSTSYDTTEYNCSNSESIRFVPNRNPNAPSGWQYPNVSTEDVTIRLDKVCEFITE